MHAKLYGKIFSNIFALKVFVGVVDASTLSDYGKTDWKDYRDRILGKQNKAYTRGLFHGER